MSVAVRSPLSLSLADWRRLLIRTVSAFSEDSVPRLAAAFSFYAMLSLAPLLVVAVTGAGWFLGDRSARSEIVSQAQSFIGGGPQIASLLNDLIDRAQKPGAGVLATVISLTISFFSASNLFLQLMDAVNTIWGVRQSGPFIRNLIVTRVVAFVSVLAFGTLLLGWIILDSWLNWIARQSQSFPGWQILSLLTTVGFLTVAFGGAFKALPHRELRWNDVWFGAVTAAIGVAAIKMAFSYYVSFARVDVAFGVAGALVVILLWMYYTSMVFFFGLEATYTYSHEFGSRCGAHEDGLEYS